MKINGYFIWTSPIDSSKMFLRLYESVKVSAKFNGWMSNGEMMWQAKMQNKLLWLCEKCTKQGTNQTLTSKPQKPRENFTQISLSNTHAHAHTHTISLSLSLSLTHTHTHTLSYSLSFSETFGGRVWQSVPISLEVSFATEKRWRAIFWRQL